MHILLTNDDGITASGLYALLQELSKIGKVSVVAPDRERSAIGHGITMHAPLRTNLYCFDNGIKGRSLTGTPADCVKLALNGLLEGSCVDLVVSGINRGENLGTDVLYSGTVSAAIEGMINGVPSLAISLAEFDNPDYTYAAQFTAQLCSKLHREGLSQGVLLNINIPSLPEEKITGVEITKLGIRHYTNSVHRREDPRGQEYYWLAGDKVDVDEIGTDVAAVNSGKISISPLHFDLTDYRLRKNMQSWNLNKHC